MAIHNRTWIVIIFLEFSFTSGANDWSISVSREHPMTSEGNGLFFNNYTRNSSTSKLVSVKEITTPYGTTETVNGYNVYDDSRFYNYNTDYYGDSYENPITFVEIDSYLNSNRTKTFLLRFRNNAHRDTIRQQLRYCPFIDLCTFSLNIANPQENRSCCSPCDCNYPSCLSYQICCPDILPSSFFSGDTKNIPDHDKQNSNAYSTNNNTLTCSLLHAKRIKAKSQESAYTYATCPTEANETMINLCTRTYTIDISEVEDILPVSTRKDRMAYRNKYCAFCNGITRDQLEFWTLQTSCDKNIISNFLKSEKSLLAFIFSSDICDLAFGGYLFNLTRKCRTSVSSCNETGLWKTPDNGLVHRCSLYTSYMLAYLETYRNVFCLQCNGYEPKVPSEICDEEKPGEAVQFSFSGLIKLTSLRGKDAADEKNMGSKCTESQMYDKTTNECRPMFCSAFHRLKDRVCVRLFNSIGTTIYTVYLRIFPVDDMTIFTAHVSTEDLLGYLQAHILKSPDYFPNTPVNICSVQMIYTANITYFEHNSIDSIGKSRLLYIDVRFKLTVEGDHDPYRVTDALNNLHSFAVPLVTEANQQEMKFNFTVIDDSINALYDIVKILSDMDRYNNHSYRFDDLVPLSELLQYSASDGNKNTRIPFFRMNSRFGPCRQVYEQVKAMAIRDCPAVELPITNLSLTDTYRGRTLDIKGFTLKSSQFSFKNIHAVLVCVDEYESYLNQTDIVTRTYEINDIDVILSIVGVSLSICCLTITIITFSLFSSLRTFPGMNTLSLCSFLLLANCLYLIGSFANIKASILCKIVGITLHFSWLAALFWMNISTFHMFRVLTHTRARSAMNWSLFLRYHIYAILSSCAFIAVNIGLSLYRSGKRDFGYGDGICYISSESMKTYTFGVPVLLVVLSNIGMFTAVIISVKRKSSIHKTSSNARNDLLIVVKLSSLTGSTWLFGFVYYWTDLYVFSYIFTVLNSSQGIFMMLSFVANQRIFNQYKTIFQEWTKVPWSGSGTGEYNINSMEMNTHTSAED